jgi:ketosteroid isomerase-like protein
MDLIERAKAFVAAVAAGAPVEEIDAFYAPDVVQVEFPNQLMPQGATRNRSELRAANERGRTLMAVQTCEVVNAVATGNTVALEVIWTGTLAVAAGKLRPGDHMRARFAQFFEFKDGLIWRQRNYDCFDPW